MLTDYKVIFGLRSGEVSGVDVFSSLLADALLQQGISTEILFTHKNNSFPLPISQNIPVQRLNIFDRDSWATRWRKMIDYLESQAPCIYIPNYDYNFSCVSPKLSGRILILGIVHSDDPMHYEHVSRLGPYWNGIVAVSKYIAGKVIAENTELAARLAMIPYGVKIPPASNRNFSAGSRLKILYVGRIIEYQKRILDLAGILLKLQEEQVPFHATIVGDGPDRELFLGKCAPLIAQGVVEFVGVLTNAEVQKLFMEHDVIVLTSDFEGLPLSVLEGMAAGCIPVVRQIRSGIPELIENGKNGFIVSSCSTGDFVSRLRELQISPHLRMQLSGKAMETIHRNYNHSSMVISYKEFMGRLIEEARTGAYRRRTGKILSPPTMKFTWKDYLPSRVRLMAKKGKKLFRAQTLHGFGNDKANPG